MGKAKVVQGPASKRVAANVAELRKDRGLSLRELSERMRDLGGRPTLPSGLSKIEQGDRRVDVDDLMALAIALDTTPNRLLLTPTASLDERIELVPDGGSSTMVAWQWASGDGALPLDAWGEPGVKDFDRRDRFRRENRPQDPPPMTMGELEAHADVVNEAVRAVSAARAAGVPMEAIVSAVRLIDALSAAAIKIEDPNHQGDTEEAQR